MYDTLIRTQQACEKQVQDAERKAKDMALEDLFGECIVDAWKVDREYIRGPKCNKCDENRKLHYTTPRGRSATENCECAESSVQYVPVPAIMARFKVHPRRRVKDQDASDSYYHPVFRWYTTEWSKIEDGTEFEIDSDTEVGCYRFADRDDTPFEKLNEWHSVFTSKERCQAFCDYLTMKNKK